MPTTIWNPASGRRKSSKTADWRLVEELASACSANRSKDLQLALWLTEAGIKLHGFPGLRDGLRLTRELMVRYWDHGLYPPMEDGPEDRAGPFEWLNNKLVDSITAIPDHRPRGRGSGLQSDRPAGRAPRRFRSRVAGTLTAKSIPSKKKAYDRHLAQGHISLEHVRTGRGRYEARRLRGVRLGFSADPGGVPGPREGDRRKVRRCRAESLSCRNALNEISQEVSDHPR